MDGIRKCLFKFVLGPFLKFAIWLMSSPAVRYHSGLYRDLRRALDYTPKEEMLNYAMLYAKNSRLEGDYLEFGVFQGDSFAIAYHFADSIGLNRMNFYAFDSFEGLPEATGLDLRGFRHFEKGQYSCGVDDFKSRISSKGVDLGRVRTVPGFYQSSLSPAARQGIGMAAIIWVDCDMYESTVCVLDFITELVQDGTLIIFDDWYCYRGSPKKGEQKAFSEWLVKNPGITASEFYRYPLDGLSFILHRTGKR